MKKQKMINSMQKGGMIPITLEEIEKVIEESEKIYDFIFPVIDKQINSLQ